MEHLFPLEMQPRKSGSKNSQLLQCTFLHEYDTELLLVNVNTEDIGL